MINQTGFLKFSFVTVTLNSVDTLEDTMQSVLNQSYDNIEYIVIDGGSIDGTVDMIKMYVPLFGGRMKWISEPDKGLYDAMNKGFLSATGDVVAVMNSDDLFVDNLAVEKVANSFYCHNDIDGVYADLYYVLRKNVFKIVRHWISGKQRSFRYGWHPAHPTFYVRREVYQKYGMFDLEFKFAADFELMLRLIEKYHIKLLYLPEPLVRMRLGGTTNKKITNIKKGNVECIKAFKKNGIKVSRLYPLFRLLPKLKQYFQ